MARKRARRNIVNGIRPPSSLRKTPVDAAAARVMALGGRTIVGNLGNPGKYKRWGVMRAFHECLVDVVTNEDPDRLHGYGPSDGINKLKVAIANLDIENVGIFTEPENIVIRAGISNIADPLLRMTQSVFGRGNIITTTPGYILYHWEGERMELEMGACRTNRGQTDVNHLSELIDENTRAVIIYSVGNPIAIPTTYDTFCGVFDVVNGAERRYGHPIVLAIDDVYRVFQDPETQRDLPMAMEDVGRLGPTLILDSISKMLGSAGGRLGTLKSVSDRMNSRFKTETGKLIDRLTNDLQITLGTVAMPIQLAFLEFLTRMKRDPEFRVRVEKEIAKRRATVRECNSKFMEALIGEEGINLNPQYGFNGTIDPNLVVAPYVVFGFNPKIAGEKCQAITLLERAHELGKPALVSTPMYIFEMRETEVWPGVRTVPMWDDQTRIEVVDSILAVRDSLML